MAEAANPQKSKEKKPGKFVLKVASMSFEAALQPFELPAFRAAIATKAGFEHQLFHNHLRDGKLRQTYPLIQYKVWQGKPMLYCMQTGIDESRHFFLQPDWTIFIGNKEVKLTLGEMSIRQYEMKLLEKPALYTLRNWIPFGSENYKQFKNAAPLEQAGMLEDILTGNILMMARGTGWEVPGLLEVSIREITGLKKVPFKGVPHLAFDVRFQANVFLPKYIGLGRKVSVGYGMVLPERPPLHATPEMEQG